MIPEISLVCRLHESGNYYERVPSCMIGMVHDE